MSGLPRPVVTVGAIVLALAGLLVINNQVRVARKRAASRVEAAAERRRDETFARGEIPAELKAHRLALLEELQPVTLQNCALARVGSPHDGGYLMCHNLMAGLETAYSYGIGTEDRWGCAVSTNRRVPVHQYDCFSPTKVQCTGGDLRLNAECVGPRTESIDGKTFSTIAAQIAKNGDTGRRMVVKMDIEGAEWDAILATPDEVLAAIDQMPMELHGIDEPGVLPGLRKLKQHFHLVSVHFNNMACTYTALPLPAIAYQVLFVNKRIGIVGPPPAGSLPPETFMAPDGPGLPDCQTIKR